MTSSGLELQWDERTGALIRLEVTDCAWSVVTRPALGMSFTLLVPAPGNGSRMVYGADQAAPAVTLGPDRVKFVWSTVIGADGEHLDIALTQLWRVDGAAIVVETEIDIKVERERRDKRWTLAESCRESSNSIKVMER